MTRPRSSLVVRPYRSEDRPQVRDICFRTGLMGAPVAPVYGDATSFADMFTGYYTDVEPESAFVAVAADDEARVLGYLLGCVDSSKAWDPARIGARHVLLRGLLFRPSTARFYLRLLADVVRDGGVRRPAIDLARYPAHFHVNLLPEARGGVGLRLHAAFLARLTSLGVYGIHAELVRQNSRTLGIGGRLGYAPVGEPFPLPGMRDAVGRRVQGQVVAIDLRDPKARARASYAGPNAFAEDHVAALGGGAS